MNILQIYMEKANKNKTLLCLQKGIDIYLYIYKYMYFSHARIRQLNVGVGTH